MVIKEKVAKAINKQINAEFFSSYLYLAMAAYFKDNNLNGFSHWMEVQSKEETGHGMKFYEYLFDRSSKAVLTEIAAPRTEWKSPLAAFEEAYAHELKVTNMINDLMKLAKDENDTATEIMLQWFITEQVEEEASAKLIVDQLKNIGDSFNGLMMLDHKLGGRK